jgi:hypothetical protein
LNHRATSCLYTEYIETKGKANFFNWAYDAVYSRGHIVAVNESGTTYDRFIYWECADLPDDMKKETLSVYVRNKNINQTEINAIKTQVQ